MKAFYLPPDEIEEKAKDIMDWTKKMDTLESLMKEQLSGIIQYGGKKIKIITNQNKKISGVLTGVSIAYLELNKCKKINIDDIKCIITK